MIVRRAQEDAILRDLFRVSAILSRQARDCGASRQDAILGHLAMRESLVEEGMVDSPFTQSKLAQIMGITSQTLGETLVKMEEEGLVARHVCEKDRRSIYVEMTDAGRKASESVVEGRREFAHQSLSHLEEEERQQLAHILRKLNDAF